MESILSKRIYQIDLEQPFNDLLSFIRMVENNLPWQQKVAVQRLNKANDKEIEPYLLQLEEQIDLDYETTYPVLLRYSCLIGLVSAIEYIAYFLRTHKNIKLKNKSKHITPSEVFTDFNKHLQDEFEQLIEQITNVIYARNCIIHALGDVNKYQHDISETIKSLDGFKIINDEIHGCRLSIDQGVIESIATDIKEKLISFVEECRKKGLITLK